MERGGTPDRPWMGLGTLLDPPHLITKLEGFRARTGMRAPDAAVISKWSKVDGDLLYGGHAVCFAQGRMGETCPVVLRRYLLGFSLRSFFLLPPSNLLSLPLSNPAVKIGNL